MLASNPPCRKEGLVYTVCACAQSLVKLSVKLPVNFLPRMKAIVACMEIKYGWVCGHHMLWQSTMAVSFAGCYMHADPLCLVLRKAWRTVLVDLLQLPMAYCRSVFGGCWEDYRIKISFSAHHTGSSSIAKRSLGALGEGWHTTLSTVI